MKNRELSLIESANLFLLMLHHNRTTPPNKKVKNERTCITFFDLSINHGGRAYRFPKAV